MTIRCYIVDNDDPSLRVIQKYIERTGDLMLVGKASDPHVALRDITGGGDAIDLVFLDIEMEGLSGMEVGALISDQVEIVFTTAYHEFAVSAFEHGAVDYLVKPFSYERFLTAVERAKERLLKEQISAPTTASHFFIQTEGKGKMVKVMKTDIIYVESAGNYVQIHLQNRSHMAYLTLNEIEAFLPTTNFIRTHKSNIVNLDQITSIEGNSILLSNQKELPIGPTYRDQFFNAIRAHTIRSKRQ